MRRAALCLSRCAVCRRALLLLPLVLCAARIEQAAGICSEFISIPIPRRSPWVGVVGGWNLPRWMGNGDRGFGGGLDNFGLEGMGPMGGAGWGLRWSWDGAEMGGGAGWPAPQHRAARRSRGIVDC